MSEQKYQAGGRVRISGKWYKVEHHEQHGAISVVIAETVICGDTKGHPLTWDVPTIFIEAYEPPQPREWITAGMWLECWESHGNIPELLNQALRNAYGEPPKRSAD